MKHTTHKLMPEKKENLFQQHKDIIYMVFSCGGYMLRRQMRKLFHLLSGRDEKDIEFDIAELILTGFLLQKTINKDTRTQMLYLSKYPKSHFLNINSGDVPAVNWSNQKIFEQIFRIDYIIEKVIPDMKKQNFNIVIPEFASTWDGVVTAADEGIIKYMLSLKEEAKHDLFFNVYAQEQLTPHSFFKYIGMRYPALLRRTDTALAYMEQIDNLFKYELNNDFYAEMNDYPTGRWFTKFFDSPDCRIFIKNIFADRNYANFQIVLLPGKKRSYKKAYSDFEEFKQNISSLFNIDVKIQIRRSLTTIPFGRRKGN